MHEHARRVGPLRRIERQERVDQSGQLEWRVRELLLEAARLAAESLHPRDCPWILHEDEVARLDLSEEHVVVEAQLVEEVAARKQRRLMQILLTRLREPVLPALTPICAWYIAS